MLCFVGVPYSKSVSLNFKSQNSRELCIQSTLDLSDSAPSHKHFFPIKKKEDFDQQVGKEKLEGI